MNDLLSKIPVRYKALTIYLIWSAGILLLLHTDAFGLDEAASRAILLVWSFVDQVAHPVVVLGAPDFRAILFIPVGMMWTGNIVAVKVLSLLVAAAASFALYDWCAKTRSRESALIAAGLMLLSPLTLSQIDSLGIGPYLLLIAGLGSWLDQAYRSDPRPLGGWYAAQVFLCALSTSMHPAGLAYPAALLWSWYKNPLDKRQQRHFYTGILGVLVFVLLVRMGWATLGWFHNPLASLAYTVFGVDYDLSTSALVLGGFIATLVLALAATGYRELWQDVTGRTLLLGTILGALVADASWAFFAFGFLLYAGLPRFVKLHEMIPGEGFIVKRGGLMFMVFLLSTVYMFELKYAFRMRDDHVLSYQDQLIADVSRIAKTDSDSKKKVKIASEWPGRTMISCMCDVFPLPAPAKDPESQLAMMKGLDYLAFNPRQKKNVILARNIAFLGGATETLEIAPGGVIVHFRAMK